jgi:hypothetical protein
MAVNLLTFKDLKTEALTLLDQAGDLNTGNNGDVLVGNAIAMMHNKRLMAQRWSFMLWANPVTLTFQSGVRNYTLHPLAAMLTDFKSSAGNWMKETPVRSRQKQGAQDDRFHFEFVQDSPINLPFAAGKLTIGGSATLTYVDTSGNVVTEALNGAQTSANVDTVISVTKNVDAGSVTIVDSAARNVLSLGPTDFARIYPQIRLYADGVTGETGSYRFYRKPRVLSLDNDIPEIPFPFSHILVYDALLELYTYNDATPPQWWAKQQADWELQLNQTYQEGEMEGAETRAINETDQYEG